MIQGFNIKTIDDTEIANQKIMLRVDLNLPLNSNRSVTDDSRVKAILPTINYLLKGNNKLIIVTYLGRPKKRDAKFSLDVVAKKLEEYVPDHKVILVEDFLQDAAALHNQKENEIILLENIRFYPEEKENDPDFAKKLASFASVYVQDAFSQMHRNEASIVSVPRFLQSYAGFLVKKEAEMLLKTTQNPSHPYVAIIGGAKIGTKINLINKFLSTADYILVGGALANTFIKAKGLQIGKSLYDEASVDEARSIVTKSHQTKAKLILPQDSVIERNSIKRVEDIGSDENILDIGPDTQVEFGAVIAQAKTIVWNGPLGYFENSLFRQGTDFIFDAIAQNTDCISIIGGGDTLAAISGKTNSDKITHISTGGGAMLEFIEKGTLIGLEALQRN